MTRDGFHRELDHLVEEVVGLGREVESCLAATVRAVETRDAEAACRNLGVDAGFKERGAKFDEECAIVQARQAPVACDLRTICAVRSITDHLVRAGTLCEHACRAVAEENTSAGTAPDLEVALSGMAHGAGDLLRGGLDAFEARDADRARDLEAADDGVDSLYSEIISLASGLGVAADSPGWCARSVLTAHYLERIADHGVEIGKCTVFLVTGRRHPAPTA